MMMTKQQERAVRWRGRASAAQGLSWTRRRGGSSGPRGRGRLGQGRGDNHRREAAEIESLESRVADLVASAEASGQLPSAFVDVPLSEYTRRGLLSRAYVRMTDIQAASMPYALSGRDILGAAKTGSGKTVAFVVPTLERLYRERWCADEGCGALIVSPTRELALQIYEVLRQVGSAHRALTVGCVTGGQDQVQEARALGRAAIVVGTPGRLRAHLEATPEFNVDGLRVLVLDEADRLLDMGFEADVTAIVTSLPAPPQRQTMLFSATQTRKVSDLARLSLTDPFYVAVHDKATMATPNKLAQSYVVCAAKDKINVLYSFIKAHLKQKTLVFVASCKQARFMYEAFRRVRPGVSLSVLHGRLKPARRLATYNSFLKRPAAILFATDVAARGLDFQAVDWVFQHDCPDDVETYIHRVGRTARYRATGRALLVLMPSEVAFADKLRAAKVPLSPASINALRALSMTQRLAAELAADSDLKYLAQRAFASYVRSMALQPDKSVFQADKVPYDALAESMGLPTPPEVKIPLSLVSRDTLEAPRKKKNVNKSLARLKQAIAESKKRKAAAKQVGGGHAAQGDEQSESDVDFATDSGSDYSSGGEDGTMSSDDTDDAGDMFTRAAVVVRDAADGGDEVGDLVTPEDLAGLSKHDAARLMRVTGMALESRKRAHDRLRAAASPGHVAVHVVKDEERQDFVKQVARRVALADVEDKVADRARVKAKHRAEKARERESAGASDDGGVHLGVSDGSVAGEESASDSESGGSASKSGKESESRAHSAGNAPAGRASRKRKHVEDDAIMDTEAEALELLRARRQRLK